MKSKSIFLILLAYTNGMVLFDKVIPPQFLTICKGFSILRGL